MIPERPPSEVNDLSSEGLITRMVELIDAAMQQLDGSLPSKAELKRMRPRLIDLPGSPAEWRRRIEGVILRHPGLKTATLADIADVTPQTIRVYRKRMKAEGRI